MSIVIADAGPIIALAQIQRLDLLQSLYGSIAIPGEVAREIAPTVPDPPAWLVVHPVATDLLALVGEPPLDVGEHAALALALVMRARWIILDDRRARNRADDLGLPVIGTIGVLLAAKQDGVIPAIRPLLDDLRESRLFVSERLVALALATAEETDDPT